MPVEVAKLVDDFNKLWPRGTDPVSKADDHIRMIKEVLQLEFELLYNKTRVFSFEAGAVVNPDCTLYYEAEKAFYQWNGTYDVNNEYVVNAGSTPETAGGIGGNAWTRSTGSGFMSTVLVSDTKPTAPFQNMLWWDTNSGIFFIYYNDGTSTQWVDLFGIADQSTFNTLLFRSILARLAAESGYTLVGGSFQEGAVSSGFSDVVLDWNTAKFYQWHLNENKVVPAGSTPATSGGVGVNAWVDRTQETLKLNFDRLLNAPSATGGANAIIVSYTPAYTSYSTNNVYRFLALSNNTDATTINIDGLGVKNLLGPAKLTCQGGEVVAGGYCEAVYDSSLNSIVLLSCVGGNKQVPDATQSHHAASYGQILNIGPLSAVHSGLSISYTDTVGAVSGLVTVTANGITLNTSAGLVKTLKSVSLSAIPGSASGVVNSLDTGAWAYSTCYHLYIIHNPTTSTTGLLWSLSATSPTLPSGYTYFARIGANFTQSVQYWFYKATQKGKRFQYALPRLAFSGTLGTWSTTAPTWADVSLVSLVPTTAISTNIQITSQYNNQSVSYIAIAPNSAFKGVISTVPPPISADNVGSFSRFEVSLLLESTSIYAVSSAAGGACLIHGWEDNL